MTRSIRTVTVHPQFTQVSASKRQRIDKTIELSTRTRSLEQAILEQNLHIPMRSTCTWLSGNEGPRRLDTPAVQSVHRANVDDDEDTDDADILETPCRSRGLTGMEYDAM